MTVSRSGRCVVVDLDDTLYDEVDFVRSGYAAVAAFVHDRFGVDCSTILDRRLLDRGFQGALEDAARTSALPEGALASMIDVYRTHTPYIRPREGARELIAALKRRDGVVACITDGRSVTQRNKLAALGLSGIFDPLLISGETGHAKPDPHNFREVMRRVSATEYWYIGDNPAKDFVAPNALRWATVGVRSPRGVHPQEVAAFPYDYRPRYQCTLADTLAMLGK